MKAGDFAVVVFEDVAAPHRRSSAECSAIAVYPMEGTT